MSPDYIKADGLIRCKERDGFLGEVGGVCPCSLHVGNPIFTLEKTRVRGVCTRIVLDIDLRLIGSISLGQCFVDGIEFVCREVVVVDKNLFEIRCGRESYVFEFALGEHDHFYLSECTEVKRLDLGHA